MCGLMGKLPLLALLAGVVIAGCGAEESGAPEPARDEPAEQREPQEAPAEEEPAELADELSVEEFVDFFEATTLDKEQFCSGWETAQEAGAEELAFESFRSGFPGGEGFSAREVFDELVTRC